MPSPHPSTRILLRHRARAEEILRVFSRYGVAQMASRPVRTRLADFLPADLTHRSEPMSDGERLREALTELGPTFIKLGQVLSTRIDLVGPDVAGDLKGLQTHPRCARRGRREARRHGLALSPAWGRQAVRRTVLAELDLVREANTLQRARANFAAEDDVVISKPYTDFSGSRVLTMSRLSGRPLVEGGMSIPGAVGTIASGAFALRLLRAARRSGGVG